MTISRLRVALPVWTWVPGETGGAETYARELLAALAHRDDVETTTYAGADNAGLLTSDHEVVTRGVRSGRSTRARLLNVAKGLVSPRGVRRALREADVVHHPFSVPVPGAGARPRVQTIADVQHLDLPAMFSPGERAFRRVTYDVAARRADAVITVSDFSRQRLVDVLRLSPDRVHVAHLGVEQTLPSTRPPVGDYVLYPARVWPHKNHARLIEAMAFVRRDRPGLRLVLTGGGTAALGPVPDWVESRGHVPGDELEDLYARAACLVFPSLYEGFGLPPLEAMRVGRPVAAARSGSMSEICGDAAVLFDPYDVRAVAEGIETALASGDRLLDAGRRRVRLFTWDACAERHAEVYRLVHERRTSTATG